MLYLPICLRIVCCNFNFEPRSSNSLAQKHLMNYTSWSLRMSLGNLIYLTTWLKNSTTASSIRQVSGAGMKHNLKIYPLSWRYIKVSNIWKATNEVHAYNFLRFLCNRGKVAALLLLSFSLSCLTSTPNKTLHMFTHPLLSLVVF